MTGSARPPRAVAAIMLLAALYAWAILATIRWHGWIGPDYDAPGTDFMAMHAGAETALRGDLGLLFDTVRFTALLNERYRALLAYPLQDRPFVYPPGFLLLLAPFAGLAFLPSWMLFQAVTAGLLAAALRVGAARPGGRLAVFALASPAASVNVLWGQTAFLTCALLVAGARLAPRRPALAGIAFGLLSVKPQHALLLPAAVLATRSWRAAAAAAASALALVAASSAAFGADIWTDWADAIRRYAPPEWDSSLHTSAVLLGAGPPVVAAAMAAALLGGAILVYRAFRGGASPAVRLAILLAASNLAAPHTGPYDTLMLVVAAGLGLSEGRGRGSTGWTVAMCVWLLPLLGLPLISPAARFAPARTVGLLIWLRRAQPP